MKKLYFFLVAMMVCFSAKADWTFYVNTTANDWENPVLHCGNGSGWWSWHTPVKIGDHLYKYEISSWDDLNKIAFDNNGTGHNDPQGTIYGDYTLNNDSDNWALVNGACYELNAVSHEGQYGNTATVVKDFTPPTVEILEFKLHGDFYNDGSWEDVMLTKQENGSFTGTVNVTNSNAEFGVRRNHNGTEKWLWMGNPKVTVSNSGDYQLIEEGEGTGQNPAIAPGEYSMSLNPETLVLTVTRTSAPEPENPYAGYYIGIGYQGNEWPSEGAAMLEVHPNADGIATFQNIGTLQGGYFVIRVWDGSNGTWIIPTEESNRYIGDTDWFQGKRTEGSDRYNQSFQLTPLYLHNNVVISVDVVNNKVKAECSVEPYKVHFDYYDTNDWSNVNAHLWDNNGNNIDVELQPNATAQSSMARAEGEGKQYNVAATLGFEPTGILFFTKNDGDDWTAKTGDLTFKNNKTFTYTGVDDNITGIEAIGADSVAPVYYNMQGVRVDNPQSGLYIMVRGNKVSKVLVK